MNDTTQKTEKVKSFFDSYADAFFAIYKQGNKHIFSRILDSTLRRSMFKRMEYTAKVISESEVDNVLDVGCGPGWYDILLAKTNSIHVTGIDISPKMIELANEQANVYKLTAKCKFICGDILDYQPVNKYDATISIGVLEYFDSIDEILRKLVKSTNRLIIFSLPVKYHWLTPQRYVRYKLRKCPLLFYSKKEISDTLTRLNIQKYSIADFGRDYMVTVSLT